MQPKAASSDFLQLIPVILMWSCIDNIMKIISVQNGRKIGLMWAIFCKSTENLSQISYTIQLLNS